MADDIDDLLDEVESKYIAKGKTENKKLSSKVKNRGKLDDDIADILGGDDDFPKIKSLSLDHKTTSKSSSDRHRPDSSRKCFPVYLEGSLHSSGMSSSVNKRGCDRLRCTTCDFRICSFDNFEWTQDTDYLFLRNNTPDFEKLKKNLKPKRGTRAYCCQCCWRSVRELEEIRDPKLKWVCGKH